MEERKYRMRAEKKEASSHVAHFTLLCASASRRSSAERAMSDAVVGAVNSVADATGLPVAAVILIVVVVIFGVLVQICRAPRSASTDANDAPELEALPSGLLRLLHRIFLRHPLALRHDADKEEQDNNGASSKGWDDVIRSTADFMLHSFGNFDCATRHF